MLAIARILYYYNTYSLAKVNMSEAFLKAAEEVKKLTSSPTDQEKLEVYALFKQVCQRILKILVYYKYLE